MPHKRWAARYGGPQGPGSLTALQSSCICIEEVAWRSPAGPLPIAICCSVHSHCIGKGWGELNGLTRAAKNGVAQPASAAAHGATRDHQRDAGGWRDGEVRRVP